MSSTKLINRLNRIQGQIDALKKCLSGDEFSQADCLKNLQLLKASINGLKKFGAAYVSENLQKCMRKKLTPKEKEAFMLMATQTGFDF